jgi:phosphoribosylanthranilate isomerase
MQAEDPGAMLRDLLSRPLVKVCGLTRQEDVDAAVDAGADLLGFIFVEKSPRRAETVLDVPETALSVAVYVGERGGADADLTQLYPDDGGTVRGRRALVLRGDEQVATLLDQPWDGTDPEHWQRARDAEGRVVLAGGLGPDNVRAAIEAVQPWAVDAASSLESAPGIKDHDKVRAYVEAAHA